MKDQIILNVIQSETWTDEMMIRHDETNLLRSKAPFRWLGILTSGGIEGIGLKCSEATVAMEYTSAAQLATRARPANSEEAKVWVTWVTKHLKQHAKRQRRCPTWQRRKHHIQITVLHQKPNMAFTWIISWSSLSHHQVCPSSKGMTWHVDTISPLIVSKFCMLELPTLVTYYISHGGQIWKGPRHNWMMSNPMGSEKAANRAPHLGESPNWKEFEKYPCEYSDQHII